MSDSPSAAPAGAAVAAAASPDQKKVRRMKIKWDEETIKEHDKLRGTRMKIDEPDTPYNAEYVASDAEEEDDDGAAATVASTGHSGAGGSGSRDVGAMEGANAGTGTLSGGLASVVPLPPPAVAGGNQPAQPQLDLAAQMGALAETLRADPTSRWEKTDSTVAPAAATSGDLEAEGEKRAKAKAFAAKRAQHYNMGEQMRLAKLAIQKEMEEEEAEEKAAERAAAAKAAEASV